MCLGARGQRAAIASHDVESLLKNVHVPVLVQHGKLDLTISYNNGVRLRELLSNSKLSTFQNSSHAYWLVDWQKGINGRFATEVNEWFSQHDQPNNNSNADIN